MKGRVTFIKAIFSSLAEGTECLEEKGATLEDALKQQPTARGHWQNGVKKDEKCSR
jgi:hypothetical protein